MGDGRPPLSSCHGLCISPREDPSMKNAFLSVALACIAGTATEAGADDRVARRPNILFLFADDQRFDALGCAGHPIVRTPTVDRLAAEGVRFRNAFVTT